MSKISMSSYETGFSILSNLHIAPVMGFIVFSQKLLICNVNDCSADARKRRKATMELRRN